MTNALAKLDKATQMLAEAKTLDEVKNIMDIAEAARTYARAAKLGLEAQNHAAEICLMSKRKAGEFLAQLEKDNKGGDRKSNHVTRVEGESQFAEAIKDTGITPQDAARWQTMAAVPEVKFKEFIADTKQAGKELTQAGVLRIAKEEKNAAIKQGNKPINQRMGKFSVIVADPAWQYEYSQSESRAIENQYPTMTLDEIKDLKVIDIAADDCVLFMWATSPKLSEAIEVLSAWGFTYKTCMVWVKDKIGMGYYARQQHELILIATRGALPVPEPSNRPSSVINAPRGKHSAKPERFFETVERMYPTETKIELFSRCKREGWEAWGNQA